MEQFQGPFSTLTKFGRSRFPEGLDDSSKYPNLFAALLEEDESEWTEEDLVKLANGNVIRVMKEMEAARDQINRFESPRQARTRQVRAESFTKFVSS